MYEGAAMGQGVGQLATMGQVNKAYADQVEQMAKITVRDNINAQIERAKAEVERLEGVRDRLAPELLDQRIVDLQQAMRF